MIFYTVIMSEFFLFLNSYHRFRLFLTMLAELFIAA